MRLVALVAVAAAAASALRPQTSKLRGAPTHQGGRAGTDDAATADPAAGPRGRSSKLRGALRRRGGRAEADEEAVEDPSHLDELDELVEAVSGGEREATAADAVADADEPDGWRTLVDVWAGRLRARGDAPHESYERFRAELEAASAAAEVANATAGERPRGDAAPSRCGGGSWVAGSRPRRGCRVDIPRRRAGSDGRRSRCGPEPAPSRSGAGAIPAVPSRRCHRGGAVAAVPSRRCRLRRPLGSSVGACPNVPSRRRRRTGPQPQTSPLRAAAPHVAEPFEEVAAPPRPPRGYSAEGDPTTAQASGS